MNSHILQTLKYRDVAFYRTDSIIHLSSLDFAAGIGPSRLDQIKANLSDLGYFVARTALSELWTLNAHISSVAIGTSLKYNDKDKIIIGLNYLFKQLRISPKVIFSHENYLNTEVSSIAVLCTGYTDLNKLICFKIRKGDLIYSFGLGYIRQDIKKEDLDIPDLSYLKRSLNNNNIRQIIPIGSRGIMHEIMTIKNTYSLNIQLINKIDVGKGGPGLQFLIISSKALHYNEFIYLGKYC